MKSLISLWKMIAIDYAIRCCTSATRDIETVSSRSNAEGMSFLTITLPSFGKDFQKALNDGIIDRNSFHGFKWRAGLPAFLSGFLDQVFDRSTGILLDDPDIDAILAIRQLTLIFSKILLPCSNAREQAAMNGYIENEQNVKDTDSRLTSSDHATFERVSALLFQSIYSAMDYDVYHRNILPKHGPGATADKLRGNAKFNQRTWTSRLEEVFPFGEFLFPSWSYYDQFEDVDILEPGAEQPVRVISVPKTQKTPRIIAVEPTAMQYAQQGILRNFLEHLGDDFFISKMLGFDDQEPNQLMACQGSKTGTLATLDLSDASDLVSLSLVKTMLRRWPHLRKAVLACRSLRADVPGHGIIPLSKFASMGSALCFPFEAMVFLTCTFIGIERALNVPLTRKVINSFLGQVRIYGDDIIIPTSMVHYVVDSLEHFGAKVGSSKSFWIGKFRESCGKEYYDGHDVSIVKVRRLLPTQRRHVQENISAVSLANQLFKAGCWGTVKWLDNYMENILVYYPVVADSSPVLGRHSFLGYETQRMHRTLHSPLVKGYVVSSKIPRDVLDGPGALLKCFLKQGSEPFADRRHLERAGRPRAVDIKLRWASPF